MEVIEYVKCCIRGFGNYYAYILSQELSFHLSLFGLPKPSSSGAISGPSSVIFGEIIIIMERRGKMRTNAYKHSVLISRNLLQAVNSKYRQQYATVAFKIQTLSFVKFSICKLFVTKFQARRFMYFIALEYCNSSMKLFSLLYLHIPAILLLGESSTSIFSHKQARI